MSISVRRYIHWQDEAPSEPTSTLVLTTPGSTFVDIRVRLLTAYTPCLPADVDPLLHAALSHGSESDSNHHSAALQNVQDHSHDSTVLHQDPSHVHEHSHSHGPSSNHNSRPATLDWAFAGTTTRRPASHAATDATAAAAAPGAEHVTWHHELDSLHAHASAVTDEALCTPTSVALSDGRVLEGACEVGAMPHPLTGMRCGYEEGWVDLPFPVPLDFSAPSGATGGISDIAGTIADAAGATSDSAAATSDSTEATSDVTRAISNAEGAITLAMRTGRPGMSGPRGVVVRVGPFVQGVLRHDAGFACERWVLRRPPHQQVGGMSGSMRDARPTESSPEGEQAAEKWTCVFKSGVDGGGVDSSGAEAAGGQMLGLACWMAMRACEADAGLGRVLRVEGSFAAAGVVWEVDEVRGLPHGRRSLPEEAQAGRGREGLGEG